jgi:hypothetical protein
VTTTRTRQLVAVVTVTVMLMVGLHVLARWTDHPVETFTKDPSTLAGLPWYTGAVGLGTGVLWFVGGALCLALPPSDRSQQTRRIKLLGLLMLVLGAEDVFILHEALTALSIPSWIYYAAYLILGLAMAWQFRARPYDAVTAVFIAGGVLLAVSLVWDLLADEQLIIEDGAKLLGVVLWCLIPVWTRREGLQPAMESASRIASATDKHQAP